VGTQKLAILRRRRGDGCVAVEHPIRINHGVALNRVHDDGTVEAIATTALLCQRLGDLLA